MRGIRKILLSAIIVLPFIASCSSSLPQGWRLPTNEELKNSWSDESDSRYATVTGDFNGDGIVDEAKLLMRKDGAYFGLFAFVSQKGGSFKVYQLDEIKDGKLIQGIGIKNVARGSYKTACGKGYWDCQKDEPSEVTIKNKSIDYFKTEGANSFFYWDSNSNNFKRVWITD